jgi:hypothetical protein
MIATKPTTNGRVSAATRASVEATTGQRKFDTHRKTALAAGVLYVLTFVSIPTLFLYGPVRGANYILGSGPDTGALVGVILELIVALAGIGTAVALFPVLKRQNEGIAMGFIGTRTIEGTTIFAGVACLLAVVSLRQAGAGAEALVTSHTLVSMYDRFFLIGQSLMPALNAVLLGSLLYRARLVPRFLPVLGLIGAPLLMASDAAILFGVIGRTSSPALLSALPIALWEFSLGVWLIVRGFNRSSILFSEPRDVVANTPATVSP